MGTPVDIALIGCGKMGGAMLEGWLAQGLAGTVHVLDPYPPQDYFPGSVICFTDTDEFIESAFTPHIYVLAVKPQIMKDVCASIKNKVDPATPVLSIAAGQTITALESFFHEKQPIIRSMPNTPAAISKGMIVATGNSHITGDHKTMANALLSAVGITEWTDNEEIMDAVTAVSGSGPAYLFLLIEAMADAGHKAGLPEALAMKLARQTVIGSAALAESLPDVPAITLRENVTSPGGTTEAALKVLIDNHEFQQIMDKAIAAATLRGKELSK